jgi:hypothetical protein
MSMTGLEKAAGIVSALLSQAPWVTTVTGAYRISLYQPAIYRGKELFLVIPLMVTVVGTWLVMRDRRMMWYISITFLVLAIFVYATYVTFPPLHWIHPINWILSYCAFGLFSAALCRACVDLIE